jgi:hypothetical protein
VYTFERSTDYPLIESILREPRCLRRMNRHDCIPIFEVGPREGMEYVLVRGALNVPLAIFLVINGLEIHFCFAPFSWGRTQGIAEAFLKWYWAAHKSEILVGPVPRHNRLALRLAKKVGFQESSMSDDGDLIYTFLKRPVVA